MKIKAKNFARRHKIEGMEVLHEISFVTSDVNACDEFFSKDLPNELSVEIKPIVKGKSQNANAYFWTLADKLAKRLLTTKEEVYREIVRRVGVFTYALVKAEDAEGMIRDWERNGVGWIAEPDSNPKTGYTSIRLYKGSSAYNASEFGRLLDELVLECEEQGIPTLTQNERKEMLKSWK